MTRPPATTARRFYYPEPRAPLPGCKTNLRPYDAVVVAILVAAFAQEQTGIDSDGDWDDWQEGIALYEAAVARSRRQ